MGVEKVCVNAEVMRWGEQGVDMWGGGWRRKWVGEWVIIC